MEFNWDFDKEPCVIDEALIINAIINQGPKGEAGRLFKEQGISYNEIKHLRLDFLDILQIDYLWILTGLTKLQLSNNLIENIENLESLTNLKELDLSFNNISVLQNLDALVNLEVFTIFENKIIKLENMEKLQKLKVFSAGNNKLVDKDNVLYLRKFENLKSLNLAGNPVCQDQKFYQFIYAYLPKIVFYEYRMIQNDERNEARSLFGSDLTLLEEEENCRKEKERLQLEEIEQEKRNKDAFVEYLGGNQLFLAMFSEDDKGQVLLQMGDKICEVYQEYMRNFSAVTKEIHDCGLEQYGIRQAEIKEYEISVKQAREASYLESRKLLEGFLVEKKEILKTVEMMLDLEDNNEAAIAKFSVKIQEINETFQELCFKTWYTLMQKELYLIEAIEKVNRLLEKNLSKQVNELVEAALAKFTQLRNLEVAYHEATVEIAQRYITRLTIILASNMDASSNLSNELLEIMKDKRSLTNSLAASHDIHLQVIDLREDALVCCSKNWLRTYLNDLVSSECTRSRNQIIEMNHFLDRQKEELHAILSTPIGVLRLPTEIQETLQINQRGESEASTWRTE